MSQQYDLVVIGAGVSGLVLASRASAGGLSTLVLEKEDRPGGCLHTWRPAPDFWLELGAHTAYNSYKALLEVLAERRRLDELAPRLKLGYRFLDDGRVQSPLARLSFPELFLNLPRGLARHKDGASLSEYYGALFGRGNYARMLSPAFAAVLSQPADAFPAQWLFRRKARMKDAPRKYTWPSGLQGLAEALAEDAPFQVRLSTQVEAVEWSDDGYGVVTGSERLGCRYLAVATAPDAAARLLASSHPALAERLAEIPVADIESMAVTVAVDKVSLPPVAGLIGVDDDFTSAVSRDPVPHPSLRGFTFHFRPGRLDPEAKLVRIAGVLGVERGDILAWQEVVNRLPALDTRHPPLAAELDRQLAGRPLGLAGNYFNGMSIGDCAERAAREAARLLALQGG
jgi:oxygen-dependent protoporphyrinogen oxidase